jgi:prephenate dehydrogenase
LIERKRQQPSEKLRDLRVTIVGLGLMGGSIALALRDSVASLTAVDQDQGVLDRAKKSGIVDYASLDLESVLSVTDLLILAVPVKEIIALLKWLPSVKGGSMAIIDLGSTKVEICELMSLLPERYDAIGGHPMCGREKSGLGAAEATLYQNQPFVLCRTSMTTPYIENIAHQLIQKIGSQPLYQSPNKHDETVAATSHLPYIVSAALMEVVNAVAESNLEAWVVSATGFRDTARLSGSDPQMMLDIIVSNRESIKKHLKAYGRVLKDITNLLENEDDMELYQKLYNNQQHYWDYRRAKDLSSK